MSDPNAERGDVLEPSDGTPAATEPAESAAAPAAAEAAAPSTESAESLRDRWLRAEADLQNFRRRAVRERDETRRLAEESVLFELIAAHDDLERALAAAGAGEAPPAWLEGVRLVAAGMRDALARFGVTKLEPVGAPFDPRFHEAILEVDAPDGVAPGHVVQVAQTGWARGERALRAARVIVARHPEEGA